MPSNNIAFARNYTSVIDEVYQRASVSGVLNSGRRMVRAGHNAKETLIPKISVTVSATTPATSATRPAPSPTSSRPRPSTTIAASACSPTSWTWRRLA